MAAALANLRVVPNFINNYLPGEGIIRNVAAVIAGGPDTICVSSEVPVDHALGDDVYEQALLSDDVPSSQGTDEGRTTNAFDLIQAINTQIIVHCNVNGAPTDLNIGHFRNIQLLIHSLFSLHNNRGFVGFTPAGLLSEYTTTIYYAATNSSAHYHNIIKIILHVMRTMPVLNIDGIVSAFKLDRGVKSGDTIKLILSLTFGAGVGANVILIPILNIVGFNLSPMNGHEPVTDIDTFIRHYRLADYGLLLLSTIGNFSILELIARIRLYANQEAFGALIEPTDAEKNLMHFFFANIRRDGLIAFIQFIKFAFYDGGPQNKNFAFFLNIFFNFYKVSIMNTASTAKIMYTDFFKTDNNYGSIIRIFNNMMTQNLRPGTRLNEHAIMFLSGSNAARAYKLIEELLNLNLIREGMTDEQLGERWVQIYNTHMTTLSDNDFMFFLLKEDSEQYRLIIRMMLGACLYYLKYILTGDNFTNLEERSISIVGHDHLLAQRLNANVNFLTRCFEQQSPLFGMTIRDFLTHCNIDGFNFYNELNDNVTLAFLDVVPKHNTAELFYISVFSIFEITPTYAENRSISSYLINFFNITLNTAEDGTISYRIDHQQQFDRVVTLAEMTGVLDFLMTQAMAVNCIATPWTLILNILYTIFVTENCVARIVVGKLGNDPKNLEKYFSILNTHLTELQEQYGGNDIMLAAITRIMELQTYIINQSQLCQHDHTDGPYNTLKGLCTVWVQQMFILVLEPATRELFFLSAAYPFTPPRRATRLEKGICYAWSVDANICNRDDFMTGEKRFNPSRIFPIAIPPHPANFQPVYDYTGVRMIERMHHSERSMHRIVPQLQEIISRAINTSMGLNVTPIKPYYVANPRDEHDAPLRFVPVLRTRIIGEGAINEALISHYTYMNNLWKRLTKRSIDLRSMFKSNVKDLKRIVGSKNFTGISLAGAYPVLLLIRELLESNNTDNPGALNEETNSVETLNCRRGLLPLLVPGHDPTLFAQMVVELLYTDYQVRLDANAASLNPVAAAANEIYSTNNILIFLGFLFSIKIKSSASIGPRNMLSLVDSIINFRNMPQAAIDLLEYTGTDNSPVAPEECSLATLSSNLDTEGCATGGVVVGHRGGAPKPAAPKTSSAAKKVAEALTKKSAELVKASPADKASAAQIKPDAIARGVSKLDSKEKKPLPTEKLTKSQQKLQQPTIHTEKKNAAVAPISARNKLLYPLLNPESGPFKIFMDKIKEVFATGIPGIFHANSIPFNPNTCVSGSTRQAAFNYGIFYNNRLYVDLPISVGGSNKKTKTNNKSSKPNNHTRRNKNNRKKNSKTKTKTKAKSSTKYKKVIPYSRSGSQSNRKKSKPKKSQKNVTFKRRRARK